MPRGCCWGPSTAWLPSCFSNLVQTRQPWLSRPTDRYVALHRHGLVALTLVNLVQVRLTWLDLAQTGMWHCDGMAWLPLTLLDPGANQTAMAVSDLQKGRGAAMAWLGCPHASQPCSKSNCHGHTDLQTGVWHAPFEVLHTFTCHMIC